jgi:hypothetical protein
MRFLQLRDSSKRLGLRDRQAALLLRGNNVTDAWTSQSSEVETWTNNPAGTAESWTNH